MYLSSLLRTLVVLATTALADDTPSSDGCVDPSGFESCYKANSDALTSCSLDAAKTCSLDVQDECLAACGNVQLAANIGCWIQSCWNQVYSCDYQLTAIDYLNGADRVQGSIDIPFYPAPENAPGACVCNLGDVWGNLTNVPLTSPCNDFLNDDLEAVSNCQCCFFSSILSDIVNVCPSNDISMILSNDALADYTTANDNSADNCAILENTPSQCSDTYEADIFATSWVNPGALPSGFPGTAPLSDLSGDITSPNFDTYTLVLFPAFTSTIVPAPYNAKNAQVTGGGQGAVSGSLIKTSGSLVSGSSASVSVPITALTASSAVSTGAGKSGNGSQVSSGSAATTSSKTGSASKAKSLSWTFAGIMLGGLMIWL